ncbi:DMT family transporter [Mesobacillus subterraneus]|uniref:DMT family transporter n=1 Tax=Mesobacillus subterraneus TaxID=285983 RepID=UPI001CFC491F|nr:DMT family transporter [Mesobacillus subterraneus]WLR54759.1 DMT family transporter [Mesobacillus subterraneus]
MIPLRAKLTASFYALLSISFWGVSFVSAKAVLAKLDPYSLLVLRFGLGALFLLVILLLNRSRLRISIGYIPHLVVLGMLVAIAGVFLVTTTRSGHSFEFAMNFGFILMILSTLNWAIYSILLKKLHIPYPALLVTFYMSLIGFMLTLPFIIRNKGWESLPMLTETEWAHLLFLAIFVSGIGYWYWGKALEVLDASKVSMFLYLEPLATLIAAIFLLHEKFILISAIGGIIIIIGVVIVNGGLARLVASTIFKK